MFGSNYLVHGFMLAAFWAGGTTLIPRIVGESPIPVKPIALATTGATSAPTTDAALSLLGVSAPATRPVPAIERVLIFSIDGCRPDMLLRCNTPRIHALMEVGSFTFWARTTPLAITLPSHISMLTGVTPIRHGITWNQELDLRTRVYPAFPTLFEVAKAHGYTSAMAAGKSKFSIFDREAHDNVQAALDWKYIAATTTSDDATVAIEAVKIITEHHPQVMFVHLPSVDNCGHAYGWGSDRQSRAIELADVAVGKVLDAADQAGVLKNTLVIITTDHGGAGFSHGPDDFRSRYIPWIAAGPGVRHHFDLTTLANVTVNTEDTFATSCYVLGLPVAGLSTGTRHDHGIDGMPRKEIFESVELMH